MSCNPNGFTRSCPAGAVKTWPSRLVMVVHRAPESAFYAAVREISELELMRAAPRAIRVIEKEYV